MTNNITDSDNGFHYVYMIREREFRRIGEHTYKIGKTTRGHKRLTEYPGGSDVILSLTVNDCHLVEKEIINEFKRKFTQMTQYGTEYFNGDCETMRETIYDVINRVDKTLSPIDNNDNAFITDNPLLFKCCKCDKILTSEAYLKIHQSRKIPCDLKCTLCESTFGSHRSFKRHQPCTPKRYTHDDVKRIKINKD